MKKRHYALRLWDFKHDRVIKYAEANAVSFRGVQNTDSYRWIKMELDKLKPKDRYELEISEEA